jgi:hypothetical protein
MPAGNTGFAGSEARVWAVPAVGQADVVVRAAAVLVELNESSNGPRVGGLVTVPTKFGRPPEPGSDASPGDAPAPELEASARPRIVVGPAVPVREGETAGVAPARVDPAGVEVVPGACDAEDPVDPPAEPVAPDPLAVPDPLDPPVVAELVALPEPAPLGLPDPTEDGGGSAGMEGVPGVLEEVSELGEEVSLACDEVSVVGDVSVVGEKSPEVTGAGSVDDEAWLLSPPVAALLSPPPSADPSVDPLVGPSVVAPSAIRTGTDPLAGVAA